MKPAAVFILSYAFLLGFSRPIYSGEEPVQLCVEPLEYILDITVDYERDQVAGTCAVTVENTSDRPARHIPFLLYRLLEVNSVTDENGRELPFRQERTPLKGWEVIEVNSLVINLQNVLQSNERRTVAIEYKGTLKGYAEQGWRYVKDHIDKEFTMMRYDGYGYPVLAIPDDTMIYKIAAFRFDYTMNVTVPKGLVVANGGILTGRKETDSTVRYSYKSKKPSWRMDIAIADYDILQKDNNTVYYFKKDVDGADNVMKAMDISIDTYSRWFGPLRDYTGFSIIEVPEGYSGQADVAAIMLPSDNLASAETIEIIYHEFSHLWNVQPLDDNPCRIESEGLAQFLQVLLSEKLDGKENAVGEAVKKHRDRFRKAVEKTPAYLTVPMCDYGIKNMVDYSYSNGMLFFTVLYRLTGEDDFNRIIRTFVNKYRTTGALLENFTAHIQETSQAVPDEFIQDWIYTPKAAELISGTMTMEEITSLYQ